MTDLGSHGWSQSDLSGPGLTSWNQLELVSGEAGDEGESGHGESHTSEQGTQVCCRAGNTCVVKGINKTEEQTVFKAQTEKSIQLTGESLSGGWEQVGEAGTLYLYV